MDAATVLPPSEGLANQIALLLPPVTMDDQRAAAFSQWLDVEVLQPLALASGSVLDRVADSAKRMIGEWAQRSPPDRRTSIANLLIRIQPSGIYERLKGDEIFLAQHAVFVVKSVSLSGSPRYRWKIFGRRFAQHTPMEPSKRSPRGRGSQSALPWRAEIRI